MVPLQNLNVGLVKIKAAREHARDFAIAFYAGPPEQFDDAPIFVVLDGVFRLCDEVGVVFGAHGSRA